MDPLSGEELRHARVYQRTELERETVSYRAVAGLLALALAFGWYWTAERGGTSRPLADLLVPLMSPAGWSLQAAPVEPVAAFPLSGAAPATASAYREGARVVWQLAGQRQPEFE
ncbi:hypothetical protein [Thermomicrobium roseum]|uniref:Uncharacterized protein n=1 Tax=Thermomicrobium roseum (strain ATCC 27502 / DSM 5159 / P-2) TaxID=309801 RepID=B9L4P4_THERP|nr:hypothetical protein [Thermomicrobium roseum]ACM06950.1 hypothetical protein trd_A0758 [Thermomicrobium roseum DSM 5159]